MQDGNKEQRLNSLSIEVVNAGQIVEHISTDMAKAIDAFAKCAPVVQWLKKEVNGQCFFLLIAVHDEVQSR